MRCVQMALPSGTSLGVFCLTLALILAAGTVYAAVIVNTGNPDGRLATASRPGPGPGSGANQETESADDFLLNSSAVVSTGAFTGLLPAGVSLSDVSQVVVEIYRVFPNDSNTARTPNVPTRANSPSDVAFDDRDSSAGNLTFSTTLLSSSFTALDTVDTGIHPKPGQLTGGDGPVIGQEVRFDVTFTDPFQLPADHYFFVPQVLLSNADKHFLWLSAPKPIVAPGTPFLPDLQSWIRNADLDPDWLRLGTDIVGNPFTFNASFSLSGDIIPEPASLIVWLLIGAAGIAINRRASSRRCP